MAYDDPKGSFRTPLILAGAAFSLSLILRQVPVLNWLIYPFQLFATLIHELSHGLAALATGGRFLNFTIAADTSGLAQTAGGWRWLIIPAGYLGAALFGGLLLVLTNRSRAVSERRWLAIGLGLFFAVMTLLFARNLTAIVVSSISALGLLALGWYGSWPWLTFGLNLLAIQCILNGLDSLMGLMQLSAGPFQLPNDAQAMSDLTHIPAVVWAVLWSLVALGLLIASIYVSIRRGGDV